MTLISSAQVFIDLGDKNDLRGEPGSTTPHIHLDDDVVVYDEKPTEAEVIEVHDEDGTAPEAHAMALALPHIPGAPAHAQDDLVIEEPEVEIEETKPMGPKDSWDWAGHGVPNFIHWVSDRFSSVPQHSGHDTAGLERAIAYLERLDSEISRAMRMDFDGVIDADKIEAARAEIDDGIFRLKERLEHVSDSKFKGKKKKKKADVEGAIEKKAQKAPALGPITATVPYLISVLARVCINGTVSAGHSIEDLFQKVSSDFKLDKREKFELMNLLGDMNYPIRRDRGFDIDEEPDAISNKGRDWNQNFYG